MKILIANTLTNPSEKSDKFIDIELKSTSQKVKALFVNPINLDAREQKSNIKIGSEVFVLVDDVYNYYVIGTTQQGIEIVEDNIYKIENKDEVSILSDKLFSIKGITSKSIESGDINIKTLGINTENITIKNDKNIDISLKKLSLKNDTAELIATLSELVLTISTMQCVGNLGSPAPLNPADVVKLNKVKVNSFLI